VLCTTLNISLQQKNAGLDSALQQRSRMSCLRRFTAQTFPLAVPDSVTAVDGLGLQSMSSRLSCQVNFYGRNCRCGSSRDFHHGSLAQAGKAIAENTLVTLVRTLVARRGTINIFCCRGGRPLGFLLGILTPSTTP
jgi:hypothetical protein